MLGERTIEINDSEIRETNRLGTSTYKWQALQEVAIHDGNVYLFVDTMLAQIIPSSAFKNQAESEEFAAEIKNRHNESSQPNTSAPTD